MYNDTYLSHYGVPGMKWGVRKQRITDKLKSGKKDLLEYRKERREYTSKNRSTKKNLYKDLNSLSNEEMQKRITRLQMEQNYANLVKNQNYNVTRNKGKEIAKAASNQYINKKSSNTMKFMKIGANSLL